MSSLVQKATKFNVFYRWNTIDTMIKSVMRIEQPFFENVGDLTEIRFSQDEIQALKQIQAALSPLHHLTFRLCKEKADLFVADVAFETTLTELKDQSSIISQELYQQLHQEYTVRKNPKLVAVLGYLHNPANLGTGKKSDPLFKSFSRSEIEKECKRLISNLFPNVEYHDSVSSEPPGEEDGKDFGAKLDKAINQALSQPQQKQCADGLKFLGREMNLFEGTGQRSDTLQKLYDALQNIAPTSVSVERVFSVVGQGIID